MSEEERLPPLPPPTHGDKLALVAEAREIWGETVARELAVSLGLPPPAATGKPPDDTLH